MVVIHYQLGFLLLTDLCALQDTEGVMMLYIFISCFLRSLDRGPGYVILNILEWPIARLYLYFLYVQGIWHLFISEENVLRGECSHSPLNRQGSMRSLTSSPPGLTNVVVPTVNWPWSLCLLLGILKTLLDVGHWGTKDVRSWFHLSQSAVVKKHE